MKSWEKKFNEVALEKGREAFLHNRVSDLKRNANGYTAAVLGRQRFEVTVKMREEKPAGISCKCPTARAGQYCEHMAAVLYAIDKEQKTDQGNLAWEQQEEEGRRLREEQEKELARIWREKEEEELRQRQRKEEEERQKKEALQKQQEKESREREARRLAREERKAERARKQEEQKRLLEEARRLEAEKKQAEEARRESARKKKEEERKRREDKRRREGEAARLAEKKRQEEAAKQAKRAEKERRIAEQRQREEAAKQAEATRREEEERRMAEQRRAEEEKRKQDYLLLGSPWEGTEQEEQESGASRFGQLQSYSYFDGQKIRNSLDFSGALFEKGRGLIRQGKLKIISVSSGFERYSGENCGQVVGEGIDEQGNVFPVSIVFSRDEVRHRECHCPKCGKNFYAWYTQDTKCAYVAGLAELTADYLKGHNIGDATDREGMWILNSFRDRRASHMIADTEERAESLSLVPRLTRKAGVLSLSFKIGTGKLFVIKKLDEFCENVKNSATAQYGTSTSFNHQIGNFTEKGREWIRFIQQMVQEEENIEQRIEEAGRYYSGRRKSGTGGSMEMFGWRLDRLYERMQDEAIEFEDKDGGGKKKAMLRRGRGNPQVTLRIEPEQESGEEFHGILVSGSLPDLHYGMEDAYFIQENQLLRLEKDFMERIEPLANLSDEEGFSFLVGRNHMAEFYYRVLPRLQAAVRIEESEPEKIRSYLPPDVKFIFYLDAEDSDITCRIFARYGEQEYSVLDLLREDRNKNMKVFRDLSREEEVLFLASQWLPGTELEKDEITCGGSEEQMFRMVSQGVEALLGLGEVRCTKRFRNHQKIRRVKVAVGVSVSSGLLDLKLSTEDTSREELMEILREYRTKKKYYRMKNGDFVDLGDDSLEMVSEIVRAMHLSAKELAEGSAHLPVYRTLYLDKMLEEHESVYSTRDSHFRKIVKGFKTVKDADFEEPASLSRIMRRYQKDGYKWLRTLESWGFGGILADDMGLGKTLQAIAVLLAAKEEGQKGTALIVSPASLVFNWGQEFQRFAPQLAVCLVTGTQEERQRKLEDYEKYDVLVTSYDLLKRDIGLYEGRSFSYEILDEAQYIKNYTTAAAKAVKVIHSQTRFALTGTPIENRLSELWSIFDYLMPGFFYGYDVFKREIETPVVKNQDEDAMKRLQKMAAPFILRRLKEDVLKDLPEKLEEIRYVPFGADQQKLYDAQVLHMRESIAKQDPAEFNKNKFQILSELTRLRQICCDPALCFENYKGEAVKVEACLQLIQSGMDGGHRMLLFSQFTSMLEILKKRLEEEKISYFMITGATPKEKRLAMVKAFNEGDTPVFLISLKAGGVGLNLTGADMVIHYDPWWNLAAQNQATDRAHRIGQQKKVTVYKLIVKNSIEEKIQQLQETKQDLADQVIGGETGQLGSLSQEELLELLGA